MRDAINKRFFIWVNAILDKLELLDKNPANNVITYQLSKSCLSSASHYRVSIRGKSIRDMLNKFKICEEELDESIGWLEILNHRNKIEFNKEIQEANELLAIVVKSIISLKKKI
jgi:four helix bundle protein